MGGICYVRWLSLRGSHGSAWAMSWKGNFNKARPKNMAKLATGSCEMPLNQQLQSATAYEILTVNTRDKACGPEIHCWVATIC